MGGGKRDDVEDILAPKKIHPEKIIKEIRIHEYNGQYSVKLPRIILEELKIKKGDFLVIEYDTKTKEYSIKFGRQKT